MTNTEFNGLPVKLQEKATEIAGILTHSKSMEVDIAVIIAIAELILKLLKWLVEWKNVQQSKLTLLQRVQLWIMIKFSDLKDMAYSDVIDTIFKKIDEETYNDIKTRKLI